MSDFLTEEQRELVEQAVKGRNVCCNACPGGGKTTTLEQVVGALVGAGSSPQILTFSSDTKSDWRRRVQGVACPRPHSFHSMAKQLFDLPGRVHDQQLLEAKEAGTAACLPPSMRGVTTLLIDEAQDMSPLYFWVVETLASLLPSMPQLVLVGDEHQLIHTYSLSDLKRSTSCYLKDPARWCGNACAADREWVECPMTISMRLRPRVAAFLNSEFRTRIRSGRIDEEGTVEYHVLNLFSPDAPARRCKELIDRYGREHVMLVTYSSLDEKAGGVMKDTANHLSAVYGIPLRSGHELGDNTVSQHTHMSCKGLEAMCVIVFGADDGGAQVTRFQQYVSLTRASHHLVLFHHYYNLRMDGTDAPLEYPDVRVQYHRSWVPRPRQRTSYSIPVTDLVNMGSHNGLLDTLVTRCLTAVRGKEGEELVQDPPTFRSDDHTFSPDIAPILGTAIPFAQELRQRQVPKLYARIFEPLIVGGRHGHFMDACLSHMHGMTVSEASDFQSKVELAVRRAKKGIAQARSTLREWGLPLWPRDSDFLQFLKKRVVSHATSRLITDSDYNLRFPRQHLEELKSALPADPSEWTPSHTVRAAVASLAFSGTHYRLCQIDNYEWVDSHVFRTAASRMEEAMGGERVEAEVGVDARFESACVTHLPRDVAGVQGVMDFVSSTCLYECKHKAMLEQSDRRQAVLYSLLHYLAKGRILPIQLVNTRTGAAETYTLSDAVLSEECMSDGGAACAVARVVQEQLCVAVCPVVVP